MSQKHRKTYITPVSEALDVTMNASLLTGSDFITTYWLLGTRNGYTDGGEQTWTME